MDPARPGAVDREAPGLTPDAAKGAASGWRRRHGRRTDEDRIRSNRPRQRPATALAPGPRAGARPRRARLRRPGPRAALAPRPPPPSSTPAGARSRTTTSRPKRALPERVRRRGPRGLLRRGEGRAAGGARRSAGEQRDARRDLCDELGEDRYDPDFDPADFDTDFATRRTRTRTSRCAIGNRWEYAERRRDDRDRGAAETKRIEGVTCVVVRDRVRWTAWWSRTPTTGSASARTARSTTAARSRRTSSSSRATTRRSRARRRRRLVEGRARRRASRGTLFLGAPAVGHVYRQELAPGDAEDAARVLSTSYAFGADPELDEFVPQALAELPLRGGRLRGDGGVHSARARRPRAQVLRARDRALPRGDPARRRRRPRSSSATSTPRCDRLPTP